jgi:hypothetical protein
VVSHSVHEAADPGPGATQGPQQGTHEGAGGCRGMGCSFLLSDMGKAAAW